MTALDFPGEQSADPRLARKIQPPSEGRNPKISRFARLRAFPVDPWTNRPPRHALFEGCEVGANYFVTSAGTPLFAAITCATSVSFTRFSTPARRSNVRA